MEEAARDRLILVVEDNSDHAQLIASVFQDTAVQCQIVTIADGQTAIEFLQRRGEYAGVARPDLILLDLNLPGKDGREILADIKADQQLRRIPIVVLTTSTCETDIFQTYAHQGNSYVIKADDREQFLRVVQRIEEFWLGIVTLPLQ